MNAQVSGNSRRDVCPTSRPEAGVCGRCGGLMKREAVFDLFENEMEFVSARCLQCADVVIQLFS
ncbi:MAG: hypothetical protein H0X47_18550 [Nitrospirales bacterium]|nr:hypothetical protein [Nitrospirales bacterium]